MDISEVRDPILVAVMRAPLPLRDNLTIWSAQCRYAVDVSGLGCALHGDVVEVGVVFRSNDFRVDGVVREEDDVHIGRMVPYPVVWLFSGQRMVRPLHILE